MLPDNPLLQLTYPRVFAKLPRIKSQIWSKVADAEVSFAGHSVQHLREDEMRGRAFEPVILPFTWGKLFDQGWFKVRVPDVGGEGPLFLRWDEQGEATLFHEETPYFGFDVAHRECELPAGVTEFFLESLCLQSAIWHPDATGMSPGGSVVSEAGLYRRDELAWETYHDFLCLVDLLRQLAKENFPLHPPTESGVGYLQPINTVTVLYRRLLRMLDDASNALDAGGIPALKHKLDEIYGQLRGQRVPIEAILTGHAHIDLVWLWPENIGHYKAVHTFSTANRLMEQYPEFIFGYSQPASYRAVEARSPALMQQVRGRIASGKWEALGASEVESDTLLACGEALARSFLIGQQGFRELQGKPSPILWLPDVFGYSGCLPQIMKQCDVFYFFTTKLTWSNVNLFPYSSFVWRGIDGSEVLTHVTQENGYNQTASAEELTRGARAYRQSDVHDQFLAPTGFGDGGGGVTAEMCERARRFKDLAGMPATRWGRVDEFFQNLDRVREKLPVYQGEHYLEYHRGVLTTHGGLKAGFRGCERALQTLEAAHCAVALGPIDPKMWQRVVFAQFHDYIPGSSIWEVYEEGIPELNVIATTACRDACTVLSSAGGAAALFNPLPMERMELLRENGIVCGAVWLPPLSGAPLGKLAHLKPESPVEVGANWLRSARAFVELDDCGRIARLSLDGRDIPQNAPLAQLVRYPDIPHCFDAWDIDRQTLSLGEFLDAPAQISALPSSAFEAGIEAVVKIGTASQARIQYRLDAFHPVLHLEFIIDWHEPEILLKLVFPTRYAGRNARFGAPFGSVLRGQQPGQPRDEACFESAGSRYAIVCDDAERAGLAIITEAKYGFSCRDGALGVSLVRSPLATGEEAHRRLFPASLRRGELRPQHTDQGRHHIRLALAFHAADQPRDLLAPALADTLFTRCLEYQGRAIASGFLGIDGGDSLVPCWAKPAEDGNGFILRLHETMGARGSAKLKLAPGYIATPVDLMERALDPNLQHESLQFEPYHLVSIRIQTGVS